MTFSTHKVWLMFDPRSTLVALAAFLVVLALLIHFLCLGHDRFNWLEGNPAATKAEAAAVTMPVNPVA